MNLESLRSRDDDDDYYEKLNYLVDTIPCSYAEARHILGEPPVDKVTDPDIKAELQSELEAISDYEQFIKYRHLSESGSRNPAVCKEGGIKKCKRAARDALISARTTYLHAKGVSNLTEPGNGASQEDYQDFDRGVNLWVAFRKDVLRDDDTRGAYRADVAKLL